MSLREESWQGSLIIESFFFFTDLVPLNYNLIYKYLLSTI